MQAVFLNNKTCERVHPVRIRKDNPDAEPFYEGMDEPLREIHDIWIMQYLRVDGAYFPRIAFEANEDENIEFDSNQEYEILSRKTDGYIYFIPENFNIYSWRYTILLPEEWKETKNPNTCCFYAGWGNL